jgi:hypothetical protein
VAVAPATSHGGVWENGEVESGRRHGVVWLRVVVARWRYATHFPPRPTRRVQLRPLTKPRFLAHRVALHLVVDLAGGERSSWLTPWALTLPDFERQAAWGLPFVDLNGKDLAT